MEMSMCTFPIDGTRVDRHLQTPSDFTQQFPRSLRHLALQHRIPILHYPDQVILAIPYRPENPLPKGIRSEFESVSKSKKCKLSTPVEGKRDDRKDDGDPGNPSVDFKGEKRKNDTHRSTTHPESRIYTKSKGVAAKLSFMGHVLMENRNGLAVEATVTDASFHAEQNAAIDMMDNRKDGYNKTLGGDKHYDDHDFCKVLRERNITPHVAQNLHSRRHHSAVDGRTTRHEGYEISQRKRKRVEEIYGWLKQWGPFRRQHFRGLDRVGFFFTFGVAVYDLLRIANLMRLDGS